MGSVRTLRVIEQELRRAHAGQRQWQASRSVVGADPITIGWNQLLEDAAAKQNSQSSERIPAALDQEVVTLARAMRGLPVAWIITDASGRIRFLGPAACGMLNLDEDDSNVGKDLPQLIGLRSEDDETAADVLQRMLGPIRMVQERRKIEIASRELHLKIIRSRLVGPKRGRRRLGLGTQ